jgi:predicted phage terminase large subunit-like protein
MPRPLTSFQIDKQREELRVLIEAGRSAFQGDTPATKAARIARVLSDRTFFQQTYLPHYFSAPPASIHLVLVAHDQDELLAAAAPREHAKSTHESIGRPLHGIVKGDEHFIVLVSDTETQAAAFTGAIKEELETNEKLRSDFPQACEPHGGDTDFIAGNDVRVLARGAGQKMRGLHHKQWRPTLIICDDLENDEAVESEEQRKKLKKWFFKALLSTRGKGGKIRLIGTILHPESLLNEILAPEENRRWTKFFWQAPDPDDAEPGPSLWPAVWPIERLRERKEELGSVFYAQEFRNQPIDEETALFKREWIKYFDDADLVGLELMHYGTCDPSLGRTDKSDFSAIVDGLVAMNDPHINVGEADIRRRKPQEICADAIEHGRRHPYVAFGFEAVGFQSVLKEDLERQSDEAHIHLPVVEVDHEGVPKDLRIRRLSPLIERGVIRFRKTQTLLIEQLVLYKPHGRVHDDGPDALEMLVRLITEQVGGGPRIRVIRPAVPA